MKGSKKDNKEPENNKNLRGVESVGISEQMQSAYLDYAMSVITSRAIPDVKDGLKPVHRRILFAMNNLGLHHNVKTRKSAAVTGEVLSKYHPHGNASVYEAMVKMAQPFVMRYPLVIGQGNFGSVDGDPPAAERYTEAKMSKITANILNDLDKDTVDFRPNYENTRKEPIVLPAAFPNILLNGTLGIAVGMASDIPPHNLKEVCDATIHLIDNEDATNEDVMHYIKGPDFPTGGIIYNKKDINHAASTGRGGVVTRGEAEIVEEGKISKIVITSIPYRVNKTSFLEKIALLVKEKKVEGIKDLRDESTDDIRIVLELKNGAQGQKILNALYKHTQLETTFHYNLTALVDGIPKTLSIKDILLEFIKHRREVVTRRSEFELQKAKDRAHILIGLKKAIDEIDKITKLIKKSKDVQSANLALQKTFKFTEVQATAILEMRLQKLANLELKKIEEELKELKNKIKYLEELLASPKKLDAKIKEEIQAVVDSFADERRTKVAAHGVKTLSIEDVIPDEQSVLVFTVDGYIKRTAPGAYKKQNRGGVGVVDLNTKDEDAIQRVITASTHSTILFFTNKGKVYGVKMYEIPEGKRATKGKSVANFISLTKDEKVTSIIDLPTSAKDQEGAYLFVVTKNGTVKKMSLKHFLSIRQSGLIAINLPSSDSLIRAHLLSKDDEVLIVTKKGKGIHFVESEVRQMGRTASGVRGIKLSDNDEVVDSLKFSKEVKSKVNILTISENGYGKQTAVKEYKVQKRGGTGISTMNVTDKTGNVVSILPIIEQSELVAMSKKSQAIRIEIKQIPKLGRTTQGVKIMRLRQGDSIASVVADDL